MRHKRETRPSRQANGRATQKSNHIVSQNSEAFWNAACIGLVLFMFLVAPHIMYHFIAPAQGWV